MTTNNSIDKLDPKLTELERRGALKILNNPAFNELNKSMQGRVADLLNQAMLSTRPIVTGNREALFGAYASNQQELTEDGLSFTPGAGK
jgi:hypothetical protein